MLTVRNVSLCILIQLFSFRGCCVTCGELQVKFGDIVVKLKENE